MKSCKLIFFLAIFLALGVACNTDSSHKENVAQTEEVNQSTAEESLDMPETGFLDDAYRHNSVLIRYNEEAANKASKRSIQNFASQSAKYHQVLKREMELMAEKYELSLPSASEDIDQEEFQELDKSKKEFDIAYLEAIKEIQSRMVEIYEEVASTASDKEIRNWSTKIVSNLKAHQMAVQELLEEAKKK